MPSASRPQSRGNSSRSSGHIYPATESPYHSTSLPSSAPIRYNHRTTHSHNLYPFDEARQNYYHHTPPAAPSPPVSPYSEYNYDIPSPPLSPPQSVYPYQHHTFHNNAEWPRRDGNSPGRQYYQQPPLHPQTAVQIAPPRSLTTLEHLPCEVKLGIDFELYPSAPNIHSELEQTHHHDWMNAPLGPGYAQSIPRHPPTPESPESISREYVSSMDVAVNPNRYHAAYSHDSQVCQESWGPCRPETPELDLDPAPEGMFPQW